MNSSKGLERTKGGQQISMSIIPSENSLEILEKNQACHRQSHSRCSSQDVARTRRLHRAKQFIPSQNVP